MSTTTNKSPKEMGASPKIPQQIERIKKQEDEEQWISGEELCTEGSSDDEDPLHDRHQLPKTTITSPKKNRSRKNKKFTHTAHHTPLVKCAAPKRPSPLIKDSTPSLLIPPTPKSTPITDDDETGAVAAANESVTSPREDEKEWKLMIELENCSYNKIIENLKLLHDCVQKPLKVDANIVMQRYEDQNLANLNELQSAKVKMEQLDREIIKIENDIMHEFKLRINEEQEICTSISNCDIHNERLVDVNQRFLKLCTTNTMQEIENKKITSTKKSTWTIRKISTAVKKIKSEPIIAKNIKLFNHKRSVAKNNVINTPLTSQQRERLAILIADLDDSEEDEVDEELSVSSNETVKHKEDVSDKKNEIVTEKDCDQNKSNEEVEMEIAFRFNNEIERQLSDIDEKLKEYQMELPQSEILENILKNKSLPTINTGQIKRNFRKDLKNITKTLKRYQQKYSLSEIEPLSDEQMSTLLKSCIKNFKTTMKVNNETETETIPTVNLSPDIREQLLYQTKLDIPKFKYKYKHDQDDADDVEKGERELLKCTKENNEKTIEETDDLKLEYDHEINDDEINSIDFDTESEESDDCTPIIRSVLNFLDNTTATRHQNFYYNPKPKLFF